MSRDFTRIPANMFVAEMAGHQVLAVNALAPRVLAVAVLLPPGNRWCVYVDHVPVGGARAHIADVIEAGHAQFAVVGKAIFPKLASNRRLRYSEPEKKGG